MSHPLPFRFGAAIAGIAALALVGCNSSSSTTATSSFSGSAVAGAVNGTLIVRDAAGNQLATATVTDGNFDVDIPDSALTRQLDFAVTGSYTDEVSGNPVNLTASAPLALRLAAGALGGTGAAIGITPETTVIRQLVQEHAMTLTQARNAYQNAFGNTPDGTGRPFDPTGDAPDWADEAANDAAFRVGAYSEWGNDMGLAGDELGQLPTALADDLADGSLDGDDASGNPVTVGATNLHALHQASPLTARYLASMAGFAGSAHNGAGLTAPTGGLPDNAAVTDVMPATRTVTLADGTELDVQLSVHNMDPFPMGPATAHTVQRVTLTNAADGSPVDITAAGAAVTAITPSAMMHMLSGMSHGTPLETAYNAASSDPANGIYDYDVYYVMASAMSMDGAMVPMGLWDFKLTFTAGEESPTALFHPNVTMPMGGAVLSAKGGDATDMVMGSTGTTMPRPYWAWLSTISANSGGGHDIDIFITAKVGMTFPAVYAGASSSTMMPADSLDIASVDVEVSTDGSTWTAMTDEGLGHYSVTGYSGLTTGASGDLWVKLTVNGNAILASGNDLQLIFTAP